MSRISPETVRDLLRVPLELVWFAVDTRFSALAFLAFASNLRGNYRLRRLVSARKALRRSGFTKPSSEKLDDRLGDYDAGYRLIAAIASCEVSANSCSAGEFSQKR